MTSGENYHELVEKHGDWRDREDDMRFYDEWQRLVEGSSARYPDYFLADNTSHGYTFRCSVVMVIELCLCLYLCCKKVLARSLNNRREHPRTLVMIMLWII